SSWRTRELIETWLLDDECSSNVSEFIADRMTLAFSWRSMLGVKHGDGYVSWLRVFLKCALARGRHATILRCSNLRRCRANGCRNRRRQSANVGVVSQWR